MDSKNRTGGGPQRIRQILPELRKVERNCKKRGIPCVSREVGQLLSILVRATRAKRLVEVGSGGGYSTLWLAESLPDSGYLITIEKDPTCFEVAQSHFQASRQAKKVHLIQGDAVEEVPKLKGTFDLAFLDGKKSQYLEYFRGIAGKLERSGLIVCDDVFSFAGLKNRLPKIESRDKPKLSELAAILKTKELGINLRKFMNYLEAHPDFETVFLPIGNGLSLSLKK